VSHDLKRHYGYGHLHFVTFSCHRRQPLLGSVRRRDLFLRCFEATRRSYRFVVVGYVVMPEHVHLLLDEPRRRDLSAALQALKQSVSRRALGSGKRSARQPTLFPDVNMPAHLWQRRFYDFNVFTQRKMVEKLRYIHRNPVKRGLVKSPEDWRWSSYRHYAFGEPGPVRINEGFGIEGRKKDRDSHPSNTGSGGAPTASARKR
jgi:putative transposase